MNAGRCITAVAEVQKVGAAFHLKIRDSGNFYTCNGLYTCGIEVVLFMYASTDCSISAGGCCVGDQARGQV